MRLQSVLINKTHSYNKNIATLILVLFSFNAFGQISIEPESESKTMAYGEIVEIAEIKIYEDAATSFGVSYPQNHNLKLAAPVGYSFINEGGIGLDQFGDDIFVALEVSNFHSDSINFTFTTSGVASSDTLYITNVQIQAATNTSPSGDLVVTMDTSGVSMLNEVVGTYTMVSSSININAGNACENQPRSA